MASNEYITISDITNKTMKNLIALITAQGGSLDEIQESVDRVNNYYEDLAEQVGVAVDDIQFPIPILSTEHLLNYLYWNYARDNNGVLNSDSGYADTTYSYMEESSYKYYTDSLKHMNKTYISGDADSTDRVSVSFGRFSR